MSVGQGFSDLLMFLPQVSNALNVASTFEKVLNNYININNISLSQYFCMFNQ